MMSKQGKNRKQLKNFSAINLLSHTSKIMDRILLKKMKDETIAERGKHIKL